MKIINIHQRTIAQPKAQVVELMKTLATTEDKVWPKEKWPKMKFKEGLKKGAKGGHGPIGYQIEYYNPDDRIEFSFFKPKGFDGNHRFEVMEINETTTEVKHTIEMDTTSITATFAWLVAIRPLHDALVEDAFDKIENQFSSTKKLSAWNPWVKILRLALK